MFFHQQHHLLYHWNLRLCPKRRCLLDGLDNWVQLNSYGYKQVSTEAAWTCYKLMFAGLFQLRKDPLVIIHNNRTSPLSRISPVVYQHVFFFCFKRPFSSIQAEIHHLGNPILAYLSIFFWGVAPSSKSKIIEDVVRYFVWRQLFW